MELIANDSTSEAIAARQKVTPTHSCKLPVRCMSRFDFYIQAFPTS